MGLQDRCLDKGLVIEEINSAFDQVECDDCCSMHEAMLIGESVLRSVSEAEWLAAESHTHQKWQDISYEEVDRFFSGMPHLSAQSWRFYLPALMTRCLYLLDVPASQSEVLGDLLFSLLAEMQDEGAIKYVQERLDMLDGAQKKAIRSFLLFVSKNSIIASHILDAQKALKSTWSPPKNGEL